MEESPYPRRGIIDTDVLIDVLRGYVPAAAFISACLSSERGITISSITSMELIAGCGNGAELRRVNKLLGSVQLHHVTEEVSKQALDWFPIYRLSHGLAIPDALIAATAMTAGLPLYTKNTRHFQMLPMLEVIRPY